MSVNDGTVAPSGSLRQWENSEFPILCEACLGDNPYVRMLIDRYGLSCKMCDRPYTVFKWRPGRGENFRKTEVCQSCARVKNLCQTCLLDLQLGLPSQLRDAVLSDMGGAACTLPDSAVNREYQMQQQLALLNAGHEDTMFHAQNMKLIEIARRAAEGREQPRVKIFQKQKKRSAQTAGLEEAQEEAPGEADGAADVSSFLPPGMTLERLPDGIKAFVTQHYQHAVAEQRAEDEEKEKERPPQGAQEGTEKKKKAKGGKFVPRPPAGPPPPQALVK
eukprot:gene34419-41659_t